MQISWVLSKQERERRFNKLKKIAFRNNLTSTTSEVVLLPAPLRQPYLIPSDGPNIFVLISERGFKESINYTPKDTKRTRG